MNKLKICEAIYRKIKNISMIEGILTAIHQVTHNNTSFTVSSKIKKIFNIEFFFEKYKNKPRK